MVKRLFLYAIVIFATANILFIYPLTASNAPAIQIPLSQLPPTARQLLERICYGQPEYVQYGCFMRNVFASWPPYFGASYSHYPISASDIVIQALPWTLLLMLSSLFISMGIAYLIARKSPLGASTLGSFAKSYGKLSRAVPPYWLALMMALIFGVYLHWLPASGNYDIPKSGFMPSDFVLSVASHFILPFAALTFSILGSVYLPFKEGFDSVARSDYVLASKVRGLKPRVIESQYISRNSFLHLLASFSSIITPLISADILIEIAFNYNGVGNLISYSFANIDYPVMEASVFYLVLVTVGISLCADLLRMKLDPRLRKGKKESMEVLAS